MVALKAQSIVAIRFDKESQGDVSGSAIHVQSDYDPLCGMADLADGAGLMQIRWAARKSRNTRGILEIDAVS